MPSAMPHTSCWAGYLGAELSCVWCSTLCGLCEMASGTALIACPAITAVHFLAKQQPEAARHPATSLLSHH